MYPKYIKRLLDLALASILVILTLPITLLTALAIKLESPGPVLFRQKRSGYKGREFTLIKFRSMTAKNNVYDTSSKDELTTVGKFIRKTSIDELPQLINIINGEMSFIGPRPWIPEYYKNMNETQRQRYEVKPGITGLAQARGRNALPIQDKIESDIEYVQSVTLLNDAKIIFMTLATMFDQSTLDIGKNGINDEIKILKSQNLDNREPIN